MVPRFSDLELLGLTAAFGIGVFFVCFIIFFFFVQPTHERMPNQLPLLRHSQSTLGLLGPQTQQDFWNMIRGMSHRFRFLEDTVMTTASSLGNVALRNYLNFLNCIGNLFIILSIPSLFFVLPLESFLGKNLEFGQNAISTNFPLSTTSGRISVWILYVLTWVYSYVALKSFKEYTRRLQSFVIPKEAAFKEVQSRTVVLHGIPVRQRRDGSMLSGKKFKLRARAILKAESHLMDEINRHASQSSNSNATVDSNSESSAVSAIHLIITQNQIHNLHENVLLFERRFAHYSTVARYPRLDSYYDWRKRYYEEELRIATKKIQRLVGDYEFAGIAIVTFATKKDADSLLAKRYYSFGMPPFASVGLSVAKAPYPDDIIWQNIQIRGWLRGFIKFLLICALVVLIVVFVTPVAIAQDLIPINDFLKRYKDAIYMSDTEFFLLTQYFPVVVILGTNSFVIPYAVYLIGNATRPWLKTDQEMTKLKLNLFFSVLTTVVIPLLGLDSLRALLKWFTNSHHVWQIQVLLGSVFLKSSGIFTLRYLINSAFLTSSSQLLQCGQFCYQRMLLMFWAVTHEEKHQARQPWLFEWGYSYAFSLTLLFQAMIFSVTVPLTAPLSAVYFKMRYFVDKYNMQYGVFSREKEFCHLSPAVVQIMVSSVAFMQFVMSGFFFVQLEDVTPRANVSVGNATMPFTMPPRGPPSIPDMTTIVFGEFQQAAMPLLLSSFLVFLWSFKIKNDLAKRLEEEVPSVTTNSKQAAMNTHPDFSAYCPPYRAMLPTPATSPRSEVEKRHSCSALVRSIPRQRSA